MNIGVATYVRNYGDNKIHKIALRALTNLTLHWTETLMKQAARSMGFHIVALHYTIPTGSWNKRVPLLILMQQNGFTTLKKRTLFM